MTVMRNNWKKGCCSLRSFNLENSSFPPVFLLLSLPSFYYARAILDWNKKKSQKFFAQPRRRPRGQQARPGHRVSVVVMCSSWWICGQCLTVDFNLQKITCQETNQPVTELCCHHWKKCAWKWTGDSRWPMVTGDTWWQVPTPGSSMVMADHHPTRHLHRRSSRY